MARELPIHNGRMTTDLDANGFKIKNLPPGSGFTQAQADWSQSDATAPDFIKNKPTIPAPVDISGKLNAEAAYPAWNNESPYPRDTVVSYDGRLYIAVEDVQVGGESPDEDSSWLEVTLEELKQDALGYTAENAANKVTSLSSSSTDTQYPSAKCVFDALELKASLSDLRYSFHTVAEWTFTGSSVEEGKTYAIHFDSDQSEWNVYEVTDDSESPYMLLGTTNGASTDRVVVFDGYGITASRWQLADRAINSLSLSADGTLVPPAAPADGKARDFVVRLTLGGTPVASPAFADSADYETEGGENLDFTAAGTYIVRMTETGRGSEWTYSGVLASVEFVMAYDYGNDRWCLAYAPEPDDYIGYASGSPSDLTVEFVFNVEGSQVIVTATRKPVFLVQCTQVAEMGSAT